MTQIMDGFTLDTFLGGDSKMKRRKAHDPQFAGMTYAELLDNYTRFTQSVSTGGSHNAGKTEALLLREMEQEIQYREEIGDTGGVARLRIGDCPEVMVQVARR